jgi:serine/threonine-protein kinase HipA
MHFSYDTEFGAYTPEAYERLLLESMAGDATLFIRRDEVETAWKIVDAIRRHGAAAQEDIDELWRRIAFSILITNVDDHLHNHGFLHLHHGHWQLAPAFDLNPFPERLRELKTWISEETGPEASIDALMSVIAYFRLPLPRAKHILREVESAVSRWREIGCALGMSKSMLEAFAEAFEHPERSAAQHAMR